MQTKKAASLRQPFADRTGLEPATSAVTGRHSNQLNYRSNILINVKRSSLKREKMFRFFSFGMQR